jgi:UDP-N-acetylglucosamine--N-acetylmuramyl-(pentapeptide) pyrophosphoryl-undecaprenol N-acetylglucosamine transferase
VAGFRPDVVLATGGYVAVPPVIAAFLLRVPILIHEQTVQIGLANRIAARFATRIALTFEGALEELPPKLRSRAFVTGNPVRPAIFAGDREAAPARFGFAPEEDGRVPCIYVTGGAQGARVLNRAVEEALPDLLTLTRIIHQCGKQPEGTEQDFDRLQARAAALPEALQRRYYLTRFVEQDAIGDAFALGGSGGRPQRGRDRHRGQRCRQADRVRAAGADRRRRADPQRHALGGRRRGGDPAEPVVRRAAPARRGAGASERAGATAKMG